MSIPLFMPFPRISLRTSTIYFCNSLRITPIQFAILKIGTTEGAITACPRQNQAALEGSDDLRGFRDPYLGAVVPAPCGEAGCGPSEPAKLAGPELAPPLDGRNPAALREQTLFPDRPSERK